MAGPELVGFIGVGKMGSALLQGVLRAGLCPAERVLAFDTDRELLAAVCGATGAGAADSALELARRCRTIVLAVKPQVLPAVLEELQPVAGPELLLISIAAGISTEAIEERLGVPCPVVRAMPNLAATVGQSATALCRGRHAGDRHLAEALRLLGAAGLALELPERLLDAVTGLSGSGPAYVFLFAEALIAGGLKVGLPHAAARRLAVQTLKGAAALLEARPEEHPAGLRDQVTTPGGTTIAGLHELEKRAFRDAVISAVEAAAARSRELGRS